MKTEIIVILDRSGSMSSIKDDAIGGFNQFLEAQKKVEGEANLTLVQFDDQYEVVYNSVPLAEVRPLTNVTFIPRGMTALYDAIGKTINKVSTHVTHPCPACNKYAESDKVIVAILTDGQENSSREFDSHRINEMISHQRDVHNWEFIFLAANQDAFATGSMLGIWQKDTFNFQATGAGIRGIYGTMSDVITTYRTSK